MSEDSGRFGDFLLGDRLSATITAEVFVVHRESAPHQPLVMKIFNGLDDESVRSLEQRVALLADLNSTHIVVPTEVGVIDSRAYLIRTPPATVDLRRLLDEIRFRQLHCPFEVALTLVTEVLDCLRSLHDLRDSSGALLCHGDLNTGHVLVDAAGLTRLIGAETPWRALKPSPRLDVAAAAALIYEILHAGTSRPLPAAEQERQNALRAAFEPITVRGLGLSGDESVFSAALFSDSLREVMSQCDAAPMNDLIGDWVSGFNLLVPLDAEGADRPGPVLPSETPLPAPIDFGSDTIRTERHADADPPTSPTPSHEAFWSPSEQPTPSLPQSPVALPSSAQFSEREDPTLPILETLAPDPSRSFTPLPPPRALGVEIDESLDDMPTQPSSWWSPQEMAQRGLQPEGVSPQFAEQTIPDLTAPAPHFPHEPPQTPSPASRPSPAVDNETYVNPPPPLPTLDEAPTSPGHSRFSLKLEPPPSGHDEALNPTSPPTPSDFHAAPTVPGGQQVGDLLPSLAPPASSEQPTARVGSTLPGMPALASGSPPIASPPPRQQLTPPPLPPIAATEPTGMAPVPPLPPAAPTEPVVGVPVPPPEAMIADTPRSAMHTIERALRNTAPPDRRNIGDILLAIGAINEAMLKRSVAEQQALGGRLGEVLVRLGTITEAILAQALSIQSGRPLLEEDDLRSLTVPDPLLNTLPEAYASAKRVLPLANDPVHKQATLLVADPHDITTINEARVLMAAQRADVLVASRTALEETIRRLYSDRTERVVGTGGALLLLCTPNQSMAATLTARLAAEGFSIKHVADGKAAREALTNTAISGIVTELALPGIDGYNLILTARSRDALRDIPIFALSSRADDYHMSKALELGADDFLPTPLNIDFLVSKLRRTVDRRTPLPPTPTPPPAPTPSAGGVSGSLAEMPLTDIVQTLELGRKTATVKFDCETGVKGALLFVEGQVVGASTTDGEGPEAFYSLASSRTGRFQILYGKADGDRNISQSTTFLLLEAMRRIDES